GWTSDFALVALTGVAAQFERVSSSPNRTRNCTLRVNSGLLTGGTQFDMSPIWTPNRTRNYTLQANAPGSCAAPSPAVRSIEAGPSFGVEPHHRRVRGKMARKGRGALQEVLEHHWVLPQKEEAPLARGLGSQRADIVLRLAELELAAFGFAEAGLAFLGLQL